MDWLRAVFSGENSAITLVIIVVGLALALVLLAWVFRKIAGDGSLKAGRNRQPRLSVTDAAIVDDKRRLVLVRRDNIEHLIMIGGLTDFVIEQNIVRVAPASVSADRTVASERAVAAESVPARAPRPQPQPEPIHHAQRQIAPMPQPHAQPIAQQHPARQAAAIAPAEQVVEMELTEADLEAEMAASRAAEEEPALIANGREAVEAASEPEIEIDLAELQLEIDRSHASPEPAVQETRQAKSRVVAPSLDAAETVAPPRRSDPKPEPRVEQEEAKAAPEPSVRANTRVKSMEDEMQRLLEELSGPARN